MRDLRFWIVLLLLAATGLLLHIRGSRDLVPPSEPLSQVPSVIAGRSGTDVPIADDALAVLGPGDFLSRIYTRQGDARSVGLFIGYFPSQRSGDSIHSPKNCLPGAGWTFESQQYVNLKDIQGRLHRVGEYVVTNGDSRQFVIYWYQAHGRSIANEYLAKLHLALDAIRMRRTDGGLVRVSTPVDSQESLSQAKERAEQFTAQLAPMLSRFIPN
jgi:EpsI family protein